MQIEFEIRKTTDMELTDWILLQMNCNMRPAPGSKLLRNFYC